MGRPGKTQRAGDLKTGNGFSCTCAHRFSAVLIGNEYAVYRATVTVMSRVERAGRPIVNRKVAAGNHQAGRFALTVFRSPFQSPEEPGIR